MIQLRSSIWTCASISDRNDGLIKRITGKAGVAEKHEGVLAQLIGFGVALRILKRVEALEVNSVTCKTCYEKTCADIMMT